MVEIFMAGTNIIFPDCIICLTPLQSNLVTPGFCGHVFHEDCLRDWRNKGNNDKCPICKRDSSHTIKLIFDIKYNSEENTNQEPQTLNELLSRKQVLEKRNKIYENEIKELTEYNEKCQKEVEDFVKKVEENTKNMTKYKKEYLNIKHSLEQEKEKNQKLKEDLDKTTKEKSILENYKKRFELKNEITEETEKIILNNIEKAQEEFETQFYKLLNDDDEKKGLREYFYVLQQKILKLNQENEELKKDKKNFFAKEKEIFSSGYNNGDKFQYTQLMQLTSSSPKKRNYTDYLKDNKMNNNKNNKNSNEEEDNYNNKEVKNNINNNNIHGLNIIIDANSDNKRKVNTIKLNKNINGNLNVEYKKMFENPFKKGGLTFKKK